MSDQEHLSEFSAWVVRKDLEAVKLLGVEYHQLQQDMFVEIDGKQCCCRFRTILKKICAFTAADIHHFFPRYKVQC